MRYRSRRRSPGWRDHPCRPRPFPWALTATRSMADLCSRCAHSQFSRHWSRWLSSTAPCAFSLWAERQRANKVCIKLAPCVAHAVRSYQKQFSMSVRYARWTCERALQLACRFFHWQWAPCRCRYPSLYRSWFYRSSFGRCSLELHSKGRKHGLYRKHVLYTEKVWDRGLSLLLVIHQRD